MILVLSGIFTNPSSVILIISDKNAQNSLHSYHLYIMGQGQGALKLSIDSNTAQLTTLQQELRPLGDNEAHVQVLKSAISRNDVLQLEGKLKNQVFGVAAIGRVNAVGKNVGNRKVGETVGVYYESNHRQEHTGFATHIIVDAKQLVFIPANFTLEQASSLLADGLIAFNAAEKVTKNSTIAVIGSGNLAYLTSQFAKKYFGNHVTILAQGSAEGIAADFGADAADVLSADSFKKYNEKFDAIVVTEWINDQGLLPKIQNLAIRTGKIIVAVQDHASLSLDFFDLIVCQREFIGVNRGDINQLVKALHAASYFNIKAKVEEVEAVNYKAGFSRAKEINFNSQVVLNY